MAETTPGPIALSRSRTNGFVEEAERATELRSSLSDTPVMSRWASSSPEGRILRRSRSGCDFRRRGCPTAHDRRVGGRRTQLRRTFRLFDEAVRPASFSIFSPYLLDNNSTVNLYFPFFEKPFSLKTFTLPYPRTLIKSFNNK